MTYSENDRLMMSLSHKAICNSDLRLSSGNRREMDLDTTLGKDSCEKLPLGKLDLDSTSYAIYTWNSSEPAETACFQWNLGLFWESPVVTKKEIVKTISEEIGMTQLKTKEIVQKTFDAIVETLVDEKRIELRNFGVFEVKKRAARKARNPRTGDRVDVPEKFVVTFKPGKEMEEKVRQLEEREAATAAAARQAAAALLSASNPSPSPSPTPVQPPPPSQPLGNTGFSRPGN